MAKGFRKPIVKTNAAMRAKAVERLKQIYTLDDGEDWDAESEPDITQMVQEVPGGVETAIRALRFHAEDDAVQFLSIYDQCTATDREYLSLEEMAHASGIGSLRLAEVMQTALFLYASMQTKMLISTSMVKVTKSIVKAATDEVPITAYNAETGEREVVGKTNGDVKAMELFGRISGIAPVPKGAQIAIQNNYVPRDAPEADAPRWKYPEDRAKEIAGILDPKQLPASAPSGLLHLEGNKTFVFER